MDGWTIVTGSRPALALDCGSKREVPDGNNRPFRSYRSRAGMPMGDWIGTVKSPSRHVGLAAEVKLRSERLTVI
jgi:hypothetical protein